MLLIPKILLYLYICYASATSDSNYQQSRLNRNGNVRAPSLSSMIVGHGLSPRTLGAISSLAHAAPELSKVEDLSNEDPQEQASQGKVSQNSFEPESVASLVNRSDISINSLDYGAYIAVGGGVNTVGITKNTISSLESGVEDGNELEKIETHTNNHQSLSTNNQNSRHYNTYQASNTLGIVSSIGHHNKFPSSHSMPSPSNSLTNNLNLNYIHNLLTKPSTSLSSLLTSNSNGFMLSSSPHRLTQHSNYSPSYYSFPSLLPPSNKLQQSQVTKQPQLTITQNQTTTMNNLVDLSSLTICGKQQVGSREPRIVGGNSTYEGEFPWAVSIQRHGNHHCGGVIVGRRWVLTAAHCVRSQLVGNLIIRTGGHTLTRSNNHITSHLERDYFVDQIIMHDDFSRYDNLTASQLKSSANTNNADIALLRLKHEINWNEFAWPVCFPNRESGNFSGHDAIVIGWGKLNEKSDEFSNELQKVKLTIIDNKVCQNWFRQAGRDMPIDDRIICAGFKSGGKDACHGDSGGPLLSKINGQYVVVGVVSTGIGCARPLLPGLYSRVSSYIGWIERHIN